MGLVGGGEREQLRGLRPDGTLPQAIPGVRVVGNHRGKGMGLNIANPRPGTVHQYADEQSNPGSVLSARQRGWWVAEPEDGQPLGVLHQERYGSPKATPVDSRQHPLYPQLVHLVTTEENFRRIQEERMAENRQKLDPRAETFLSGVSAEEVYGSKDGDVRTPTRFALRGHGHARMEGEHVLEQMTPDGILWED